MSGKLETNDFIGRGWGFPIRLDPNGAIAIVSKEREIEEAIRIILGTSPGERPMRPEFGCRIHDYVFAPVDSNTAAALVYEVRQALRRWEPRIELNTVDVTFDSSDRSLVYIDIRYTIRATNSQRNLVFPFYTIPQESDRP